MKIFILLLFLCLTQRSVAQNFQFPWVQAANSANGRVNAVAYSSNGDFIYAGGSLTGNGTGPLGNTIVASGDGQNGFVAKYQNDGTIVWSFNIGGIGTDNITAITVDASDNVIIAGNYQATANFKGFSGSNLYSTASGVNDIFVVKYNASGVLVWLKVGVASTSAYIHDMTVDASNNIYLAGSSFGSFTFDGNANTTYGGEDAFGLKLLSNGNFSWLVSAGSNAGDQFRGVTVFNGEAYFGGYYAGTSASFLGSVLSLLNLSGSSQMLLSQYNASTGANITAVSFGGSGNDRINDLTNDGLNLYLAGNSIGSLTMGSNSFSNSYQEIIVSKLNTSLSVNWAKSTSHTVAGNGSGESISVSSLGRLFLGGNFTGTINNGYQTTATTTTSSIEDGLIFVYSASSGNVVDQTIITGNGIGSVQSIAVKNDAEVIVGGLYWDNTVFIPITKTASNTNNHPFVGKISCAVSTATLSGSATVCSGVATNLTLTFTGTGPYSVTIYNGISNTVISGITGTTYSHSVSPTSTTTYTISAFSSNTCSSTFSGSAVVNVYAGIANNVIYGDTTHCGSAGSSFTGTIPTVGSGAITYLWQYNQGAGWFSGQSTNNLQNYSSTSDPVTNQYRRRVSVPGCPNDFSNIVTATIIPVITNNDILTANQICLSSGSIVLDGNVPSGGGGGYIYNWEYSQNGGSFVSFSPSIANEDAAMNPFTLVTLVRRSVKTSVCTNLIYSDTVILDKSMTGNTITTPSQSICQGASITLAAPVPTNGGTFTYLWEKSPDNFVWTNANNINNQQNYTTPILTSTTYFRRSVSSGACGFSASTSVMITVDNPVLNNTITANQTICSGSTPSTLTGSTPTGGNGTSYVYSWQQSLNGVSWSAASGTNNGINYSPGVLSSTTHYKRAVTSGVCTPLSESNTIIITVDNPVSNNSISANQTICSGNTPTTLSGSTPTGGNGTSYVYSWQQSLNGVSWSAASGTNNGINYSPGPLSVTTYYKRTISSGVCTPLSESNVVIITVHFPVSNNSISSSQTICSGSTPSTLTGSTPTGGNGTTYVYSWQQSLNGVSWSAASGTNNGINSSPGALSVSTYYRRIISSGVCTPLSESNIIIITVDYPISNNTISGPSSICYSPSMILDGSDPTGGNGTDNYVWEFSSNGTVFNPIAPPVITEDYQIMNAPTSVYYYRRKDSSGVCPVSYSNIVLVDVTVTNNTVSSSQTICLGDTAFLLTGPAPTTGAAVSFEWEESLDNISWSAITGNPNSGQTYQPFNLTVSTYFRRKVNTSGCGDNLSNSVLITVHQPTSNNTITNASQTICSGSVPDSILGSVPNGGISPYAYLWQQKSIAATSWANASGANSNKSYLPGALTQTTVFRRLVNAGVCDASISNVDTVYVDNPISGNSITSVDQQICSSTTPDTIFGTSVVGIGLSYIWQDSTSGVAWNTASGATANSPSYFPGNLADTTYYRRIVTGSFCGNDTTQISAIFVHNPVFLNIIYQDTTICYLTQPNLLNALPGINGFGYEWEQSFDSTIINGWLSISGATNSTYAPGILTDTIYYRRVIDGGFCPNSYSNVVTISVTPPIENNTIDGDTTVCWGIDSLLLIGSVVTGGVGNNTYIWESSLAGLPFTSAQGVNNQINFITGTINEDIIFRRRVINNTCPNQDSTSNTVTIGAFVNSTASFVLEKDSVCDGMNISVDAVFSGAQPFTLYMMYGPQNRDISGIAQSNYTFNFLPIGSNSLIMDSIMDFNGCTYSLADTLEIRIIEQPITNLYSDTNLCDSVYFFNPTLSFGTASLTSPTIGNISNVLPFNYAPTTFGEHDFILTETNEICSDADTMRIGIWRPIGEISAGEDQIVNDFYETNMNATDLVSTEIGKWQLIDGQGIIGSIYDPATHVYNLTSGSHYFVWHVNNGVCPSKSDTVRITVQDFFIPSGFSPNGDGTNDLFVIRGILVFENIGLQVFNRWGNSVYANKNYQNDWDGKMSSGKDLPDDTYFYILDVSSKEMYKGYLVIKR